MTTTLISNAAPAWLRELASARTDYEELLGWRVSLEVSTRNLVIPIGQAVDAITMPARLGEPVQFELRLTMLDGPVITGLARDWFTFLTEPSPATSPHLPADLVPAGVRTVARGERVALPVTLSASDRGERQWFNPPRRGRKPPPWSVVVGISRRVTRYQAAGHSGTRAMSLPAA